MTCLLGPSGISLLALFLTLYSHVAYRPVVHRSLGYQLPVERNQATLHHYLGAPDLYNLWSTRLPKPRGPFLLASFERHRSSLGKQGFLLDLLNQPRA